LPGLSTIWDRITAKLVSLGLTPRTRLARFTMYVAGIELLLLGLQWIFKVSRASSLADSLNGWTRILGFFLSALLVFLALRWFRVHVMWSVRNRLIVTYLFIGAVPIALVLLLVFNSVAFLADQFGAYLAASAIEVQSRRLETINASTARFLG